MSKALEGAVLIGAAVLMGTAAFFDPALIASPYYDKIMFSLALGGISMEAGAIASALTSNRGTSITTRQPAAYRQIVYGERRVGGILVYESTTGSHHDQYNAVIVLAGHEVDSIVNMYIDGRKVYWLGSGDGYSLRNGVGFGGIADSDDHVGPGGQTYNFGGTGHSGIYVEARYGDQLPGDVIGALTANDPAWAAVGSDSPYGGGCCYLYVKLEYNEDLFPAGPAQAELKFTVRGKNNLLDPRTGERGFSNNWALIIGDLLQDTQFGLGDLNSVNADQWIAAANVCDEAVELAIGGYELRYCANWNYDTSVSPGDALANLMNAAGGRLARVGGEWFIYPAYWQGATFDFDEGVLTGDLPWNPYRSLRDLANEVNGTYIAANYPWNDYGNLYDTDGWYDGGIENTFPFGFQPTSAPQYAQDVAHGYANNALLEEDSGVIGEYDASVTYALDDTVTVSGVIYRSLIDSNVGNDPTTHSVISGPAASWAGGSPYAMGDGALYSGQLYVSLTNGNTGNQPDISPSDWGAVAWVKWNNQLPMELDLNCVLSVGQWQRLAKIALLRNRQQGSGTFPMHLKAWQMAPLSCFTMTFAPYEWSSKVLEVVSTRFYIEDQQGVRMLRFEAAVQETSEEIYEWSTEEELTVYGVPGNPGGLPLTIDPPSDLSLSSDATTALTGTDGTITPRILAEWTAPPDVRVTQIQVQHKRSTDVNWHDDGAVDVDTVSLLIGNVTTGDTDNVRIRSLSGNGATSVWVESDGVSVFAPNSLQSSYSISPQFCLTQPTSTSIVLAAVVATFGAGTASYATRTFTITAPSVPTWYYVTIADPTQQGESGATLTPTCSLTDSLVGMQGNTFMGAILALPAGSATDILPGGWPNPQAFQVIN